MNPPAAGGLTRSTRRVMSNTPGGRRSPTPTPWGSPTRRGGGGSMDLAELSATAQMAAVAGAVGESLIAADLPCIIAHRRRLEVAGVAATAASPTSTNGELLESPALAPGSRGPNSARKPLEAHAILITARSLKSVESSTSRMTNSEAGGGSARCGRHLADVEQLKCLLLQGLLLALPLLDTGAGWPACDPAGVLAAEVLSLLGRPLSPQQEQLKQLGVQVLQRLSQRPGRESAENHPLVAAAGSRLHACLTSTTGAASRHGDIPAVPEACEILRLLTDYVMALATPSVAAAATSHCLPGLQAALGVLLATAGLEPSGWPTAAWQLFHGMVSLLGPMCTRVDDANSGRALLGLLLADRQTAALLANVADHLLLEADSARVVACRAYRSSTPALQRDLLYLLTALATLAGRQPPAEAPAASRTASRLSSLLSVSSGIDELAEARPEGQLADPGSDLLLGEQGKAA